MVSITIPRSGMDVPVVRPLFFESLRSPRLVRLAWSGDPGLVGAARSPCRGNLSASPRARASSRRPRQARLALALRARSRAATSTGPLVAAARRFLPARSEEHTSELQSRRDLVCRLLLEKKKRIAPRTLPTSHKEHRHKN